MPERRLALLLAAIAVAGAAWHFWPGDARSIRRQLGALSRDIDGPAAGGSLEGAARAARIGSYFTDDVFIDLGQGTAPIQGRDVLVAMLARLDTRTAEYTVRFQDASVRLRDAATADVTLTAEIYRRASTPRDSQMDAREFDLTFRKTGGDWRIARVRAVDTIRR